MPYILPSSQASRISAGETLPEQDRQVQECLSLIEVEIREAASKGLNKAHLLQPRFAGWDKSNPASGPSYMLSVFNNLVANGYGCHTEPVVPVHESMGLPRVVPYTHTSVTWVKTVFVNKTSQDNERGVQPPPSITDNLQRKWQEAYGGEAELAEATPAWLFDQILKREEAVPQEWVLESKALTDQQIEAAKADMHLSIPSQKELDLGANEVFSPEAPMPGRPAQLVNYLRNRGFALKGFGVNSTPQSLPPYTVQTGNLIHKVTKEILDAHLRGPEDGRADVKFDPVGVDISRVQKEFSIWGFHFTKLDISGSVSFWWPQNSWEKFQPAPLPATSSDPETPVVHLDTPFNKPGKLCQFVNKLRGLGIAMTGKSMSAKLLAKEGFEDDAVTRTDYERVLNRLFAAIENGETILQMPLAIDCKVGRIEEYLEPLGFHFSSFATPPDKDTAAHQLLSITWKPFK